MDRPAELHEGYTLEITRSDTEPGTFATLDYSETHLVGLFRFWVRESLFSHQPEAQARQKSPRSATSSLALRVSVRPETEEPPSVSPKRR